MIRSLPRLLFLLSLANLLLLSLPCRAELVDRVVAVVNDEVITASELEHEGAKMFAAIRRSTPADKQDQALSEARYQLLEKMIDSYLIVQKAKEYKIDPSPEDVDAAINRLAEENHLTREELLREVAREGLSEEEYRKFTADQIRRQQLVNYEISSRIVISDDRVKKYYEEHYLKETPPQGYHLLQMGFKWGSGGPTLDAARKKAGGVRKLVEAGQDFRELARASSELPSARDGGDLGAVKLAELTGEMRQMLEKLKAGEVSPVIETGSTVQFFQVLTINTAGQVSYPPYIVVKAELRDRLFQEDFDKRLENWMKELREQAIIKELL